VLSTDHLEGLATRLSSPPGVASAEAFDPAAEGMAASTLPGTGRTGSKDRSTSPTRSTEGGDERRISTTNEVVEALDPYAASNTGRYQPTVGADGELDTYCNVFAHDYAWLMGAFLPRVWWLPHVLASHQDGTGFPDPVWNETVGELTANQLYSWLEEHGHLFGWARLGATDPAGLTEAQKEANDGRVVIISASAGAGYSGHVTAVVPESGESVATRDAEGLVRVPVQAEAGAAPQKRGTATGQWWETQQAGYPGGKAIWVHA
jgi:hypothetical protein